MRRGLPSSTRRGALTSSGVLTGPTRRGPAPAAGRGARPAQREPRQQAASAGAADGARRPAPGSGARSSPRRPAPRRHAVAAAVATAATGAGDRRWSRRRRLRPRRHPRRQGGGVRRSDARRRPSGTDRRRLAPDRRRPGRSDDGGPPAEPGPGQRRRRPRPVGRGGRSLGERGRRVVDARRRCRPAQPRAWPGRRGRGGCRRRPCAARPPGASAQTSAGERPGEGRCGRRRRRRRARAAPAPQPPARRRQRGPRRTGRRRRWWTRRRAPAEPTAATAPRWRSQVPSPRPPPPHGARSGRRAVDRAPTTRWRGGLPSLHALAPPMARPLHARVAGSRRSAARWGHRRAPDARRPSASVVAAAPVRSTTVTRADLPGARRPCAPPGGALRAAVGPSSTDAVRTPGDVRPAAAVVSRPVAAGGVPAKSTCARPGRGPAPGCRAGWRFRRRVTSRSGVGRGGVRWVRWRACRGWRARASAGSLLASGGVSGAGDVRAAPVAALSDGSAFDRVGRRPSSGDVRSAPVVSRTTATGGVPASGDVSCLRRSGGASGRVGW